MAVELRFGFDDGPIRRHLAALMLLDARGFDGVRREIGEYLRGDIQDNLDKQQLFDGTPMQQSAAARERKGKTLIDRHHLYDSYNYQLIPGGIEIGSPLEYARIHHFGGETGRPGHRFTLPARPVMGIGDRQEHELGNFLIDELTKAQGGAR